MTTALFSLKTLWPILISAFGFVLAIVIVVRYKIPDLTRRIGALEKKGADTKDLSSAIDGFHTVCKFNQATCQKENQHGWMQMQKQFDEKMGEMYERINNLAVSNAKLVTKVDLLLGDIVRITNKH